MVFVVTSTLALGIVSMLLVYFVSKRLIEAANDEG